MWPSGRPKPRLCAQLAARLEGASFQICSSAFASRVELVPFPVFSPVHPQLAAGFALPAAAFGRAVLFSFLDLPRAYALGYCLSPLRGWSLLILAEILNPELLDPVGSLARGGARSTLQRRLTQGPSTAQIVLSNDPAPLGMTGLGSEDRTPCFALAGRTNVSLPTLRLALSG
jgi:hypothetical protein